MSANLTPKSNVANKVRNTRLPKTQALLPLFEVVSNAIHSIEEAIEKGLISKEDARIVVKIIRNGDESLYVDLPDIDQYPIRGFEVFDNGVGFNDENLAAFMEADTDHKLNIGGKGIGRFVCLKAFKKMMVSSIYVAENGMMHRAFTFTPTKDGFTHFVEESTERSHGETVVSLVDYGTIYQKNTPTDIYAIAREVATHFQLFFLGEDVPNISLLNQNSVRVDVNDLFRREYAGQIQQQNYYVGEYEFTLILTKSFKAQSHKLIFCAHNRSVIQEGLYKRIIDLGKSAIRTEDEQEGYYYQAFVTGSLLDDKVDTERFSFDLSGEDGEEDDDNTDGVSLAKIRRGSIEVIETMLEDYLSRVRTEKIERYKPIIEEEMPQYRNLIHYKDAQVKLLPPDLSKEKLDIELYKIEADWKQDVKETRIALLDPKKDITDIDEYKKKYQMFLSEFNDIGQAELARYVVHRKSVLDLFDNLISAIEENKFTNEEIIHSIFFPIRSSSDEVPFDKQNLWLLDERLAYHSFLASDKTFESIPQIESNSKNKADLLIFNDAISFVEDEDTPFNSFTIVEFKKPQRDNYVDNDAKKNPLDQVEMYIDDLLAGKVLNRKGRIIQVSEKTPFYVYIVCDITDSFKRILHKREFVPTADGRGYFKCKSQYYTAYIEVIPFDKVLSDAKKRNRILFEKLGIN